MNKISPNPVVRVSIAIPTLTINKLSFVIKDLTKLSYGHRSIDMIDTDTLSFQLTLCGNGNKKIAWKRLSEVESIIRAFFFGTGNNSDVKWPAMF